jgi:hypothetical protein
MTATADPTFQGAPAAAGAASGKAARNASAEINERIREHIDGKSVVNLAEYTREFVAHLLAEDPSLVERFLHEQVYQLVYNRVQRVAAETRGTFMVVGGKYSKRTDIRETVENALKVKKGWFDHLEYVAGVGHVRLGDMTKRQLLIAADTREARGGIEFKYAATFRQLAAKMPDNEDVAVRDIIPEETEIGDLHEALTVETIVTDTRPKVTIRGLTPAPAAEATARRKPGRPRKTRA